MENKLCFITIFVALLLVILMEARRKYKTKNLPPGPWKLPIIGNMHQLVGSLPHHRLTDLADKYGPIMHLQLGELSTIVISSPELAKEVMKTHDLNFASRPFLLAAEAIVYNTRGIAFSPYGDYWRQLRKICIQELLGAKRVQSFRSIREEEVSHLVGSIAFTAGAPVNLSRMVTAMSYCITSRTAVGKTLCQRDAFTPIFQKILCVIGGFSIADLLPSVKLLQVMSGMRSKLQKLHQEADAILEDLIREHRERKKSENNKADDLLTVLLNLHDRGMLDIPSTIQEIKAVIMDVFIGGYETSSTVIEWTMSEMMKHPKILERAQAEVRRVFNGKEKIEETSLQDLTYLNSVIKESLRLHPPGPLLLPREAQGTVEICGYKIPEKTQVIVNARAIARDPKYWIEPEKFYPERFLNNCVDYKGTDFKFIPFGAGRRICPAILYGMSVIELVLANLLYHFNWKIPDGVKSEDLDMSETFSSSVRRRNDLLLIPIPFNPLQSDKS